MEWITKNPLWAGLIGLAIVVFIVAGFAFLRSENKREESNLKNQGAAEEKNRTDEEIFNAIQNANRPLTSDELLAECLRNNRNPAACRS